MPVLFQFSGGGWNFARCCSLGLLFLAMLMARNDLRGQSAASGGDLERWLDHAERLIPQQAEGFVALDARQLRQAAKGIDDWAAYGAVIDGRTPPENIFATVERLVRLQQQVDGWLDALLRLRVEMPALTPIDRRSTALRNYLQAASALIDLSGRLRYLLSFSIDNAAFHVVAQSQLRERLIDVLISHRVAIGADVMSVALFDPPPSTANRVQPASVRVKSKLLNLIAISRQNDVLPRLAAFVADAKTPPALVVQAAETIRQVGLPQDERPGQTDPLLPKPPITAARLHEIVSRLDEKQLPGDLRSQRDELLTWLAQRRDRGLTDEKLQMGAIELEPGDWLLMRNPSPYNLFTDLSPGLFTHVGVVTSELGPDGRRRMVLVDLPEQGKRMDATNVDQYVQRSLHYFFMRHDDRAVAEKMGDVARAIIGHPTEFDLNFRTDRVAELRGKPLTGQVIRTYCAGLLLLCAQETTASREEFFPLPEGVRGGRTAENLARLGISFGKDFISPSGVLFSPKLEIIGRREPLYDPRREVEEAIFDHFALSLETKTLAVSTDLFQSLRVKVAEAARQNPLLSQALAKAAGVGSDTDLVGAAKAAAVVEILDEIAYGQSGEMLAARTALTLQVAPEAMLTQGATAAQIEQFKQLRRRHADLAQQWAAGRLSPRSLREALVKYYIERGQQQLDQRFFAHQ